MHLFITCSLPIHEENKRTPLRSVRRASALLISLLLMAFLAVFGIGMSQLIVKSIRVERNVVEAGKAYFAAESGVERALYFHENQLPGYEVESGVRVDLANGTSYEYEMSSQGNQVPCLHGGDSSGEEAWRTIEVQESVSWPLFRYDVGTGGRVDLEHFDLIYSVVDRHEVTHGVSDDGGVTYEGNALRWKILGIDAQGNTQAISGLLPFSGSHPTQSITQESTANFFDSDPGGNAINYDVYFVSDFLLDHTFNYFVLTNVVNSSTQSAALTSAEDNLIQLKLSTADGSACEYTLIRSTGFAENTRQAIDSLVKLDEALPVFDFVLYQTN